MEFNWMAFGLTQCVILFFVMFRLHHWKRLARLKEISLDKPEPPTQQPLKVDMHMTIRHGAKTRTISFPEGAPLEEVFIKIDLFNNQK